MLNKIWKDRTISLNRKFRGFNSNVKPVLYYVCETWKPIRSCVKKTPDLCQWMSAEDSEDTMDREVGE